jgi:hypothetical protein
VNTRLILSNGFFRVAGTGRRIALLAVIAGAALACSPATISRIGLPRPPRAPDCSVKVLDPGETPDRPIVDIGVVALENCPDYNRGSCIKWLKKAACELGGEVAYLPNPHPPKDDFDAVTYRVQVAVYAVSDVSSSEGVCEEPDDEASGTERCME